MPRGPKGEKRPADVIGNAVKIMRVATGEEGETYIEVCHQEQPHHQRVKLSEILPTHLAKITDRGLKEKFVRLHSTRSDPPREGPHSLRD